MGHLHSTAVQPHPGLPLRLSPPRPTTFPGNPAGAEVPASAASPPPPPIVVYRKACSRCPGCSFRRICSRGVAVQADLDAK
jgi:hypothetical protein